MSYQILEGDVIEVLRTLESCSVQCVVTSPPYFSLRNYDIPPSIWGGDPKCGHRFAEYVIAAEIGKGNWTQAVNGRGEKQGEIEEFREPVRSDATCAYCADCGAWRGQLGLEPSIALFLEHIVDVFRHIRRVLHPSGTLWVNFGDTYCSTGGAGGQMASGFINSPAKAEQPRPESLDPDSFGRWNKQWGCKPKDLAMIPAQVALALQADGWFLRSQIPWVKFASMPESAVDRPTSAVEYLFLFSKSETYYYDKEAVRINASSNSHARGGGVNPKACGPNSRIRSDKDPYHQTESRVRSKQNRSFSAAVRGLATSRMRRNSDWFFCSIEEYQKGFQGMLVDHENAPAGMVVNAEPFSIERCDCGAIYEQPQLRKLAKSEAGRRICTCGREDGWTSHFATFPQRMVAPCLLASTSSQGRCGHCGAPQERIIERTPVEDWRPDGKRGHDQAIPAAMTLSAGGKRSGVPNGTAKWAKQGVQSSGARMLINTAARREQGEQHDAPFVAPQTLRWEPTCTCRQQPNLFSEGADIQPCVVLDPFSGSGRTGLAALKLGLTYIGIERNSKYATMSRYLLDKVPSATECRGTSPAPVSTEAPSPGCSTSETLFMEGKTLS